MLGQPSHPVQNWRPAASFVPQSGDDIWAAVVGSVRGALAEAGEVAAIRDACSRCTLSKLPWLRQHRPAAWAHAALFLDRPDFVN